jgi:N-formylglutamate amidohydrolase
MIQSFVTLRDESVNILATAIHNGHAMHPDLLADCGISEAERRQEEDPYTEAFTLPYPNRLIVYTSRFTVDLNRSPDKAVYLQPGDCWGLPVRKIQPTKELLAELKTGYDQWYFLLDSTIKRLLEKHTQLLVLDMHSYNHRRGGSEAEPDPQIQNPDIILGRSNMPVHFYPWVDKLRETIQTKYQDYLVDLNATPVKAQLTSLQTGFCGGDYKSPHVTDCQSVLQVEQDADPTKMQAPYQKTLNPTLDCRIDVKFPGGYMSRWLHHFFPSRVCSISVEFKKIFMDEWSGKLDTRYQNVLTAVFHSAVQELLPEFAGQAPHTPADR